MSKNYVELKVSELRDECKSRNLDVGGLKVHLVERLNKYDREQQIKTQSEFKAPLVKSKESEKIESPEVSDVQPDLNGVDLDAPIENSIKTVTMDDKIVNDKVLPKEDRKRPHETELIEEKKENILFYKELDNWENRTDVHLDFYNSDMNMIIDETGYLGTPLHKDGFEYMCAAVKGNYGLKSGKVFYEVKILKNLKVDLNNDVEETNFIKIGWSTDNESLTLGDEVLSFAYDSTGKRISQGNISDYGIKFEGGDVIGCFLEFNGDCFSIRYTVNGVEQGEAFNILSRELKDNVLMPHIYVKNVTFEVNFGQNDKEPFYCPKTVIEGSDSVNDETWTLLGKINLNQRTRALKPPKQKSECEVLMMCGLPSCGKTNWTEKQTKDHSEKRYNVLSVNTVLEKMKVNNLRKRVSSGRWESFISTATRCLNKLMEMAVTRRRNFILDQTNVYPSAQRRRMKPFEEFIRKAIIIVPTDDEYQRRMNQVIQEEGKDVPESAVLQLKENFVIPEENNDLFNEIIFIELQRSEAEELIKKYNEEAKNHKKKESNSDVKVKRDADDDNYGKWASSPRTGDDGEPSAPKKSRWNDQMDKGRDSKSKDRHDRASPERLPRKNDYKGGFCFSREASDTGKGGNRSSDGGFDRHDKSREHRGDRSGNRSNAMPYRRSGDGPDRKPKFDDSKFGNRNAISGGRDSRPRDRGNESRGGSQFQSKERSRGGFNDRRPVNSFDNNDSRNKFAQSGYNDRNAMNVPGGFSNNQDRPNNRYQQTPMQDRGGDFRGRGRGGAMVGGGAPFNDRRNIQMDNRAEYQTNYSDFDPYSDNRQVMPPWQPDYNEMPVDHSRRGGATAGGYDNGNNQSRYNQPLANNYEQQYGGATGRAGNLGVPIARGNATAIGSGGVRGGINDNKMMTNAYNDRKPVNIPRGSSTSQPNRGGSSGRTVAPLMDVSAVNDYSYSSTKVGSYDQSSSNKYGNNKPSYESDATMSGGYKDSSYGGGSAATGTPGKGGRTGGYSSRFADAPTKPYDAARTGMGTSRDNEYAALSQTTTTTTPYENYQSYDNNSQQFNQPQQTQGGYYNYYTGDSSKDHTGGSVASSNYSQNNTAGNRAGGYQATPSYQGSGVPSNYNAVASSNNAVAGGYPGTGYSTMNSATTGTGYQSSNYQASGVPANSGGAYKTNYSTGTPSTGGYQSFSNTGGASIGGAGGVPIAGGYQQSNYSSSSNMPTSASTYTNPYNAIYDSASSSYSASYYGQTNTYAQSGSYGTDSTTNSKYSDYSAKPPLAGATNTAPVPQNTTVAQPQQTNWSAGANTGYGDYSQYYGQYYGQ